MSTQTIRVGVNGYGVVGKRIADTVAVRDDTALIGVADAPVCVNRFLDSDCVDG